jgi:hypothetical protein
MAREVCPAARPSDCQHLARLLDLDGNRNVTLPELEEALVQGGAIEAEVSVVWVVYDVNIMFLHH